MTFPMDLRVPTPPPTGPSFLPLIDPDMKVVQIPPGATQTPPINAPRSAPVRYVELKGSPRFHMRDNAAEVVREFIVQWDDPGGKFDSCFDLLGYAVVTQAGGGEYLQRFLPGYFPRLTTNGGFENPRPYLWATQVRDIDELVTAPDNNRDADGVHRYLSARIVVVYETVDYDVIDDLTMASRGFVDNNANVDESYLVRYVTKLPQPAVKIQTLPQNSLIFVSAGSVQGTNGKYELEADLEVIWRRVPQAAVGERFINPYITNRQVRDSGGNLVDYIEPIPNCLGCLNDAPFAGKRKGTLMLSAAILVPIQSPLGDRIWDIRYRFKYFNARSTVQYANGGNTGYVYGHVLILRPDMSPPIPFIGLPNPLGSKVIGYDEAIVSTAPRASNYLLNPSPDGVNPYNFRPFSTLFQVPVLARDNGG